MEWKVENALSRDIERQQLNKILKDVRASIDTATKAISANTNADIKAIVGQMFTGNTEVGVSAVYNAVKKVIDLSVPSFFIRLQGDVEGTGQVNALGDVTIVTSLAAGVGGIEEAPEDGSPYWRNTGEWEEVPVNVQQLAYLTDVGIVVSTSDNTLEARTLETGDGIDIINPAGDVGNPEISFNADTAEVSFIAGATYNTVQKFIDTMHSPGIITGGDISDIGSGSVRISAGTMMIRIADDDVADLPFSDFAQTDFLVPDDQLTRFFGVVYNSGSPIVEMRTVFDWDKDTEIPLGSAVRLNTAITIVTPNKYRTGDPITNVIQRFDAVSPVQRDNSVGGLGLGETGTRNVTVSAGTLWSRLSDFPVSAKDSSVDTMLSIYFNGTNLTATSGLTQWDNTQYNDTGTGSLVVLGNNKYANLWFFMSFDGTRYGFAYGTAEHNTLGDAATESIPFYLTQNFFNQSVLLGRFIFQKSAATAGIIESAFITPFSAAAINTHNNLGGLQGGTLAEFYHLTASQNTEIASLTGLAGTGVVTKTGADSWGFATTTDLPEGSNLYFTDALARSAVLTTTITNGDTTHAPDGNAVFDALALKEPVITAGTAAQFINGEKTATNRLTTASGSQAFELASYGGAAVFRALRAGGTEGSPSAITNGSNLFVFDLQGWDGSNFIATAAIQATATQNWSVGANATNLTFRTTNTGSATITSRWVIDPGGGFRPAADNTYDVGTGTFRVREYFGANATINTSDAREKTEPRDLTPDELACAIDLARLPCVFQWLAAVEAKGDDARLHVSPTVQAVIACMESHGLNPFRWGFVCYDAWDATPEVRDEGTGEVTQEAHPAGDRYSLRPSELQHFIAGGVVARQDALEARLDALESPLG